MKTCDIIRNAVGAKKCLSQLSSEQKNSALLAMALAIEEQAEQILAENAKDMEAAKGKISDVKLDRLLLTNSRIQGMADGIRDVVHLPDPVGRIITERTTADGLELKKISVPLGVIAIIYESRPNVTSDAAALCLKSGNVCILRGGKEAYCSSHAIVKAMQDGLKKEGLPAELINIIDGLIRNCLENASVPCIETGTGICTVYVDASADQDMALRIIENAKTQRPSVCNAEEICLVSREIAKEFLPKLKTMLVDDRKASGAVPVELRLSEEAAAIIDGTPASPTDFDTEFLDYILAVKVVADVKEAVEHIAQHSTHHSEAIVTRNQENADYFAANVDSAAVYINTSTRFTDGGMFGLGCEMGISTQKLHARGPMGLEELNTDRYVIKGTGQVRK